MCIEKADLESELQKLKSELREAHFSVDKQKADFDQNQVGMQAEISHLSQELRFQIKQHNEIKHLNDQKALDLHKYTTESAHLH